VLRDRHRCVGSGGDGGGVSGIGDGRGAGRHRRRRCVMASGRQRSAWRSGRRRNAADDHRRWRHGLVVRRLYRTVTTAVATCRPVGRCGLARHDDCLRVPALVARAVFPRPATSAIAV